MGAEPGESSWQGSVGKGVPEPPGSDFREKAAAGEQHSLGSGDSQVANREQEASQGHLGVQERDGGAGKKVSGLSCPFC